MHRALALAAGLSLCHALSAAAVPSHAELPGMRATVWLCSLSDDATRLHCVADEDPLADEPAPANPGTRNGTVVVRGTQFPLDRRQRWTVDLWSPFSGEPEWLRLLARATLCFRTPACQTIVHLPGEFRPAAARTD